MKERFVEKLRTPFNYTIGKAINKLPEPYKLKLRYLIGYFVSPHANEIPYKMRYKMWKRGFEPVSFDLYDFEKYEVDEYLSNIERQIKSGKINEPNEEYLNDKELFYKLLMEKGYKEYLPERYGIIDNNWVEGSNIELTELLKRESKLATKPKDGSGGNDFHKLEYSSGDYFIDGNEIQKNKLIEKLSVDDEYLVGEFCEQAAYVNEIFPETANTVRILTINPSNSDPYISIAVQRIGTKESHPVDNFGKGGISAMVDSKGKLSNGVRRDGYDIKQHQTHPDTDSKISGVKVPGWTEISEDILTMAEDLQSLPYIAWDIIVTGDGNFKIIEGNNRTDVDLLQCHQPLLRDDRTLSFYKKHDVVEESS